MCKALNKSEQSGATRLAYTKAEAAALLGISMPTLDRLVRRGLLKPSRALRRPLFSRRQLERFLEETVSL
jgi:excisionase family DNA binding protein